MSAPHPHTVRAAPLLIALAAVVAGCSGGDDTSPATEPVTTSPSSTAASLATTTAPASTAEPATTTPPLTDVEISYAYAPPDGNVDDWLDNFGTTPDPAAGVLGLVSLHGIMQVTGDWQGTTWYVDGVTEHPLGFIGGGTAGRSLLLFSGTTPCGTGTAVYEMTTVYPAGIAQTGASEWDILPGYGTGDLEAMTGGGTGRNADGESAGSGTLSGAVSCEGAEIQAAPPGKGSAVELSLTWGEGEYVTDPGGTAWQAEDAIDPASGQLGLVHGHGPLAVGGDAAGDAKRVWVAVQHPLGWLHSAGTRSDVVQLRGTVEGCGTGTMVLIVTSRFGPGTAVPSDPLEADADWEVLPGYGTGDLTATTGGGSGSSRADSATGDIELTGELVCGN